MILDLVKEEFHINISGDYLHLSEKNPEVKNISIQVYYLKDEILKLNNPNWKKLWIAQS